jgi:toxin-antitoxin system PIN domain toxin
VSSMKKATSDLLLLDVNVLPAMAWPNRQFHLAAIQRLESSRNRWATCALTQLGFIRLSSNSAAVPSPRRPAEAAALLRIMVQDARHVYLEALPSPIAQDFSAALEGLLGHQQVTDAYLLALARRHGATFVTFDTRLKHLTAPGATVEVLGQPA